MNKNVKKDFEELLKYHNVSKLDKIFDSFSGQVNRYLARIEEIRNNPDLVILSEGIDGLSWAHKNSAEGKKHLRRLENNRIENEAHAEMMSNISETVFEEYNQATIEDIILKTKQRQAVLLTMENESSC